MSRGISRREFLRWSSALGVSTALSGGLIDRLRLLAIAQARTKLSFFVFEGPNQDMAAKEVVRRYTRANPNVQVDFAAGSNAVMYPRLVAARRTSPTVPLFNLFYTNPETIAKGDRDGMWLSLDRTRVPNLQNVYKEFRRPEDRGAPVGGGLIGLMYNKERVKEPPTSWRDLWENPQFKKRVVLFDYLWAYNGLVVAARLNGGNESNIDPGFRIWSQHADQILALVTSTQQMLDLMVKGDAWLTAWFKGNQVAWAQDGAPLGFAVPKEGAVAFPLYVEIVAGTDDEKKRVGEEIINLLLDPLYAKLYCETTYSAPLVNGVKLRPDLASDPSYGSEALTKAIQLDWVRMADQNEEWRRRWDREVKSRL